MATRSLRLVINVESGQLLPFVDDLTGSSSPRFVVGDNQPIEIYLIKPSSSTAANQTVLPVPPGSVLKTAIGVINKTPTAGEWFLSYDGDETAALSATCTAAELQTALNDLASITSAGGVTVSKLGTQYNITFNNPGDRMAFVSRNESLFPASVIQQQVLQEGTVSASEVVLVNLSVRPIALLDTYTDTPAPAGTVTGGNVYQLSGSYRKAGTYRLQITWTDTEAKSVWTDPIAITDTLSVVSQKIYDAMTFGGWGRDIKIDEGGTLATTVNNWGLAVTLTDAVKWRVDFVKPIYQAAGGATINPYAGKFKLSYGGYETGELDATASATAVQDALNLLSSITSEGGVTVKKDAGQLVRAPNDSPTVTPYRPQNQQFIITFNQPGARTAITVNPLSLYPISTPVVTVQQTGTSTLAGVVTFKLVTDASQPTATLPVIAAINVDELPYLPGKCGVLDLATAEAIAYLGTKESQSAIIEVQLDAGGEIQTICQTQCTVLGQVIADGAYAPQTLENAMSETEANARFVRRDVSQSPTDGEQDVIWSNLGVTTQDGRDVADAITGSNIPTASNPFATMADIGSSSFDQSLNTTDAVEFASVETTAALTSLVAANDTTSITGKTIVSTDSTNILTATPTEITFTGGGLDTVYGWGVVKMDGANLLTATELTFPSSGSYFNATSGIYLADATASITYPDATVQTSAPQASPWSIATGGAGTNLTDADYPHEVTIVIGGTTYAMPARII